MHIKYNSLCTLESDKAIQLALKIVVISVFSEDKRCNSSCVFAIECDCLRLILHGFLINFLNLFYMNVHVALNITKLQSLEHIIEM